MSANSEHNDSKQHSTQTTLTGETATPKPGELSIEGLGAILWNIGREYPDADVHEQVRRAAERAADAGYFDRGEAE